MEFMFLLKNKKVSTRYLHGNFDKCEEKNKQEKLKSKNDTRLPVLKNERKNSKLSDFIEMFSIYLLMNRMDFLGTAEMGAFFPKSNQNATVFLKYFYQISGNYPI